MIHGYKNYKRGRKWIFERVTSLLGFWEKSENQWVSRWWFMMGLFVWSKFYVGHRQTSNIISFSFEFDRSRGGPKLLQTRKGSQKCFSTFLPRQNEQPHPFLVGHHYDAINTSLPFSSFPCFHQIRLQPWARPITIPLLSVESHKNLWYHQENASSPKSGWVSLC